MDQLRISLNWRRVAFALGIFMTTSGLLAACSSGGGDGSDEDYVKAICESNEIFDEVIAAAFAAAFSDDAEEPDEDELISTFERWADALDDANPPADMASYHNALVDGLREAIDAARDGETDSENMFDDLDDLAEPPAEIQERLAGVATGVSECEGQELFGFS